MSRIVAMFVFLAFATILVAQPVCSLPGMLPPPNSPEIAVVVDVRNLADRPMSHPGYIPLQSIFGPGATEFSRDTPVAPGEVVSLLGVMLTFNDGNPVWVQGDLRWELNGTSVIVNGSPVPMIYAGMRRDGLFGITPFGSEVIIQIPYDLEPGPLNLQVQLTYPDGGKCVSRLPLTLPQVPVAPGVLPVIQDALTLNLLSESNPAVSGGYISLYGYGFGATEETVEVGIPTPMKAILAKSRVSVSFDGQEAEILYFGLTPGQIGLYQVNARVPTLAPGDHVTRVAVDGKSVVEGVMPVR